MTILKNDCLKVNIKSKGAELCSIQSVVNKKEFVWQANPDVWGSHAPNLFPIIGMMKDSSYIYNSKMYHMPKHGFVRHNEAFKIEKHSDTKASFNLETNDELHELYPFDFEFSITYELIDNVLHLHHSVKNRDSKPMYFSVGGHPAFNCPINTNEDYTDYVIEFEYPETSESHLLNMSSGLVTNDTKKVFSEGNKIQLKTDLFNEDALIFKDLKSRAVSLKHKEKGPLLKVEFDDFSYLGIWAKPNAPYVCIEPWLGIADAETTNQKLKDKEGMIKLLPNSTFNASYSIEIDKAHLS